MIELPPKNQVLILTKLDKDNRCFIRSQSGTLDLLYKTAKIVFKSKLSGFFWFLLKCFGAPQFIVSLKKFCSLLFL